MNACIYYALFQSNIYWNLRCAIKKVYRLSIHVFNICDTGTQKPSFLAILFNRILRCICFKILFTEWKYLAYNWSYIRLIRTIKKVKKSIKEFMIFRVIVIYSDHYFIIMKLFLAIKFFTLNQIKQMALKSGCNLSEFKNYKLVNPSLLFGPLAQYLGSDRRRVLSPCVTYLNFLCPVSPQYRFAAGVAYLQGEWVPDRRRSNRECMNSKQPSLQSDAGCLFLWLYLRAFDDHCVLSWSGMRFVRSLEALYNELLNITITVPDLITNLWTLHSNRRSLRLWWNYV